MIVPLTITLSLFWGNFRATNYLAWPYLIWIFLPYLLYWSVPLCSPKVFFCCYPASRLPKCPFSYRSNGEMWVRKWSKKVTNHFPFPIIFESGKKAFKCGTSRVCHGRVAFLCVYHTTPLTCKLSKLLKIIFLLTVVLVTTAACSNTREP